MVFIPERFQPAVLKHPSLLSIIADHLESIVEPLRRGSPLTEKPCHHSHALKNFVSEAMHQRSDKALDQNIRSFFCAEARRLYEALVYLTSIDDTAQCRAITATMGPDSEWQIDRVQRRHEAYRTHAMIPESEMVELEPQLVVQAMSVNESDPIFRFLMLAFKYIEERVVCMRISCPNGTVHHFFLIFIRIEGLCSQLLDTTSRVNHTRSASVCHLL